MINKVRGVRCENCPKLRSELCVLSQLYHFEFKKKQDPKALLLIDTTFKIFYFLETLERRSQTPDVRSQTGLGFEC